MWQCDGDGIGYNLVMMRNDLNNEYRRILNKGREETKARFGKAIRCSVAIAKQASRRRKQIKSKHKARQKRKESKPKANIKRGNRIRANTVIEGPQVDDGVAVVCAPEGSEDGCLLCGNVMD